LIIRLTVPRLARFRAFGDLLAGVSGDLHFDRTCTPVVRKGLVAVLPSGKRDNLGSVSAKRCGHDLNDPRLGQLPHDLAGRAGIAGEASGV